MEGVERMGNDPKFAAEMAALAAARREQERGRTGDGMAVETTGWMGFDGPRVKVPPHREKHAGAQANTLRSVMHIHDAACLTTVAGGVNLTTPQRQADGSYDDGMREVPEPGWTMCSVTGIRYHDHDGHRMAHWSRDRSRCAPIPEAVPA